MITRRPRPAASWPKAIMRSGVRWAETTRTSWATSKRSSSVDRTLHDGQVGRAAHHDGDEWVGGAHRLTSAREGETLGCRRPQGQGGRPGPGPYVVVGSSAHRHVSQFASWPGTLAIQVDVGAAHGQAVGEERGRILAPGATEDVDAGHLGIGQARSTRGGGRAPPAGGSRTGR